MSSVVCTLFEGDYHYGLAALANSLFQCGYRGTIWAGYRGTLPPWARLKESGDERQAFEVAEGLTIQFLKVGTPRHFTNYKADFMTLLGRNYTPEFERMFYFDPDIILRVAWKFIEDWAEGGVALCEDVNSPMPATHPIRKQWLRFAGPHGLTASREMEVYVNGGFVGVAKRDWSFVETWERLLSLLEVETSGLARLGVSDRAYPFHKPDQDALNMTTMFSDRPLSIVGREGMDFIPGGYLMSHALGTAKPWRKSFLREAMRGYPPSMADHAFMRNTETPISLFSPGQRKWKKLDLLLGCALGRFYGRR